MVLHLFSSLDFGTESKFEKVYSNDKTPKFRTKKHSTYYDVQCNSEEAVDGRILLNIKHKIPRHLLGWYHLGWIFGIFIILFIFIGYNWNPTNTNPSINCYFVLSSIAVSYLVVLKGWVFQKKMDHGLMKIDNRYKLIISLIILDLLYIIFRSSGLLSSIFAFLHLPFQIN